MSQPIGAAPGPDAPRPGPGPGAAFRQQVASGLAWTMIGTWGRQAIDLLVFIVLARLLAPEDFGLVALAMVFVLLAQLIVDQGMGDALIQRREINDSLIDTAFWVAVATGLLLTVTLVGIAGPISTALREPALQPILQVLSLSFALSALTSIQIALLRRRLDFRSLSIRALVAAAGGGVVGVVMAAAGMGPWALVGQQVASAFFSVIALWRVTSWRPRWHVSRHEFGELFRFGIHVVAGDVLTFMTRNVDNLLIGTFLGPVALGFYVVGYRMLSATQAVLVQITRKMTFPVFSRLQDDRDRMRRAYYRVTRAAAAVILPGYVALALVATELTVVLFGQRWERSGSVATILLIIGPVVAIQALSIALLNSVGRPDVAFRFRLLTTITTVVGFAVAVPFGIDAVAAAYVIPGYLLLPVNLLWMRRHAGLEIGEYLGQMRGVAAATGVMVAAVLGVRFLVAGAQPEVVVPVLLSVAAVAFAGALWLLDRALIRDVVQVAVQASPLRRGRPSDAR